MLSKAALWAGVSLLVATHGQVRAAEAGTAPDSVQSQEQVGIQDIVVTARRRSEGLLETPVAVTAFSAADLERRAIQKVSEIQASTPSLIYEGTGGNSSEARIFIRGVGNAIANISSEQGVGIYIDGMYYARSQGAVLENIDIASLEVLRGPQGTLFGKNTIGGAINITTVKPDTDGISGAWEAGYGRFDRVRARGALNIPLGDKAAVRLSAMRDYSRGFTTNDFDGSRRDNIDVWALTGALRVEPTDTLTWDVNALYTSDRNKGRAPQCVSIAPHPVFGASFAAACAATNANGINHTNIDVDLDGSSKMFAASTTLAWNAGEMGAIDDLTFKLIGGYQWSRSYRKIDYDATFLNGLAGDEVDKQSHQFSGEFQMLAKALDDRLNFVFGAYVDRERTPGSGLRFVEAYSFLEPLGRVFSNIQYLKLLNSSHAAYSQFTYDFNPIVSLTGGLRYTDDTKGFYTQKCNVSVSAPRTCVGPDLANGTFKVGSKSWTPMASLQFNAPKAWTENGFLDQAMLYLTYSRGFKSGGINGNGEATRGNLTSYKPERVENYEIGAKFSLFDRRLIGSISAFDMTYKDIQLNVQGISPETLTVVASVFNAGAAKIQGLELELQALLADSLRLSVNADLTDARYTRFDDAAAPGGTRVGEPLAYIPDYRISGAIENRFTLGEGAALTPRIQVTRTGERYLYTDISPVAREIGRADAVTIVDATMRLDLNEQMSLDVYGKNIFNKRVLNDAISFGYQAITWYSAPTTYGATMRYKF